MYTGSNIWTDQRTLYIGIRLYPQKIFVLITNLCKVFIVKNVLQTGIGYQIFKIYPFRISTLFCMFRANSPL